MSEQHWLGFWLAMMASRGASGSSRPISKNSAHCGTQRKIKTLRSCLLCSAASFYARECALTVYRFGLFSFSSSLYWTMAFKCGSWSSICGRMWRRSVNPLVGFLQYKLLLLQLGLINAHIIIMFFCSAVPEICSACCSTSTCNSLSSYLKDLLQLFVVLHHDDIGLGVFCYILARLRRVGGVDAHSKPTVRQRHVTQSAIEPFTSLYCSNRINIQSCWLRGLPFADMHLISQYRYCSFTSSRHGNKSLQVNQKRRVAFKSYDGWIERSWWKCIRNASAHESGLCCICAAADQRYKSANQVRAFTKVHLRLLRQFVITQNAIKHSFSSLAVICWKCDLTDIYRTPVAVNKTDLTWISGRLKLFSWHFSYVKNETMFIKMKRRAAPNSGWRTCNMQMKSKSL